MHNCRLPNFWRAFDFKEMLRKIKKFILNLLFPLECLGCRREGDWLCANCFRRLKFSGQDKSRYLIAPNLEKIFIAGDYDDPLLSEAIKKFKYGLGADLGPVLSRFLILFWGGQLFLPENRALKNAVLIPIPLSKKRLLWRGFNQSEILTRELAAAFAYPINLDLQRNKYTQPQAELNGRARLDNIKDSFSWAGTPETENLAGKTIILIDDVVTTGATLNEAAAVLKKSGAKKVYGLILAKG